MGRYKKKRTKYVHSCLYDLEFTLTAWFRECVCRVSGAEGTILSLHLYCINPFPVATAHWDSGAAKQQRWPLKCTNQACHCTQQREAAAELQEFWRCLLTSHCLTMTVTPGTCRLQHYHLLTKDSFKARRRYPVGYVTKQVLQFHNSGIHSRQVTLYLHWINQVSLGSVRFAN